MIGKLIYLMQHYLHLFLGQRISLCFWHPPFKDFPPAKGWWIYVKKEKNLYGGEFCV